MTLSFKLQRSTKEDLTFFRVVVTDVFDSITYNLLVVYVGSRCDLTAQKYHASLTNCLCKINQYVSLVATTRDKHKELSPQMKGVKSMTM